MFVKKVNGVLCVFLSFIFLSGCSQTPLYKAATKNSYGYNEAQIAPQHYVVSFMLANASNQKKAHDYALKRAAELTSEQGYDWFNVLDVQTKKHQGKTIKLASSHLQSPPQVSRRCGLLTCDTQVHYDADYNHSIEDLSAKRGYVEVVIEIKMGKGIRPNTDNIYSANFMEAVY